LRTGLDLLFLRQSPLLNVWLTGVVRLFTAECGIARNYDNGSMRAVIFYAENIHSYWNCCGTKT
jgi:hypothetical protein